MLNELIIFLFLISLSILDYKTYSKTKAGMPSFLNTLFILTCILINPPTIIILAISILFPLILWDIQFYQGVADLKILTGILILLGNLIIICGYLAALVFLSIAVSYLGKKKATFPYLLLLTSLYYLTLFAKVF